MPIVFANRSFLSRFLFVSFVAVCLLRPALGLSQSAETEVFAGKQFLQSYCVTCHGEAQPDAGTVPIALDPNDLEEVSDNAETWEKVLRKLRAGVMPPVAARRPSASEKDAFIGWLEAGLDRSALERPNPGRTEALHRLNRSEYGNAVRDLLGLEIDVTGMVAADDSSYGFDNIAGVLGLSPTLAERYLAAAAEISRIAVGSPPPAPDIDFFRIPDDLRQEDRLPGLALGTRGGTLIRYTFPMDAEYTIRASLARDLNESVPLYRESHDLEIAIDGERVGLFTLPGVGAPEPPSGSASDSETPDEPDENDENDEPQISQVARAIRVGPAEREARNRIDDNWEVRVPVSAGAHDVQVAFIAKTSAIDESTRLPFLRPYPAGVNIPETRMAPYLRSVEISGPYDPTGAGESESRERIFVCHPGPNAGSSDEEACAETILETLARRAWRRPVAAADIAPLVDFFRDGADAGGFESGIEHAIRRLLVSPEFLFRVTPNPRDVTPGAPYLIDDVTLASRLSFFLWSSIPDDGLLGLAEAGRLSEPSVLRGEVERMIGDAKFDAFVENFAGQWLFLRNLDATIPVQSIFPDFDDSLRRALRTETEMFFKSTVVENRSAKELLDADYTFLNERLAGHYGVPNVKGSHFRRVSLGPGSARAGLLGHGSILAVTSYPDRTSPVVRGKWILENLLGTPPPTPPPNVPELEATDAAGEVLSMRERMVAHRANPVCASCHAMMDPLGFALENFDAVGRWQTIGESGARIDATGRMPDGREFDGLEGLRTALGESDLFVTTLTEKMLTYALGRGLEYYDQPAVRTIVRDASADDYRLASLIQGIVESVPFRMRRAAEE